MNAHIDRIRDLAREGVRRAAHLTPTQRVSLLAGLLVVAAVLIWWFQIQRQSTEVLLPNQDLTSSKRSEMLQAFADANLTGFTVVDDQIHIPRGQAQKFLAALPDDFSVNEPLSYHREAESRKSTMFQLSSTAAWHRQEAALRDLENVIRKFEGVEDVFIHLDERIENGLKPKRIGTAVVAVVTDGRTRLSRNKIDSIRGMVGRFRSGMQPTDVMVIDVLKGVTVGGSGVEDSQLGSLQYAMRIQEEIEQHWQEKIRDVLKFVPKAQVVVTTPTPKVDPEDPSRLEMTTDRHIGISVSVPTSYHRRRLRTHRGAAQATPQQIQKDTERQIRQAIDGLIKAGSAEVVVTTFDDLTESDVVMSSGWIDKLRQRKWTAGVALLVAAAGMLMIHVASRGTRQQRVDEAVATISLADGTVDPPPSESTLDPQGSDLRATLTDRIQSDPDQAVRVLNQWLSRAG